MSISKRIIKFPYRYKLIDFGKIIDPVISLQVLTRDGWENIRFLVDSGADTTTLPLELAKHLESSIDLTKKTKILGAENRGVIAYPGKIKIKVSEKILILRSYFVESDIIPLLGRLDVWDNYSIIFDNSKQEIVFETIDH